jgi:hypothetical protein
MVVCERGSWSKSFGVFSSIVHSNLYKTMEPSSYRLFATVE